MNVHIPYIVIEDDDDDVDVDVDVVVVDHYFRLMFLTLLYDQVYHQLRLPGHMLLDF